MSLIHNFITIDDHDRLFYNRGILAGMSMAQALQKLTQYAAILEANSPLPSSPGYISSEEEENDQNTD